MPRSDDPNRYKAQTGTLRCGNCGKLHPIGQTLCNPALPKPTAVDRAKEPNTVNEAERDAAIDAVEQANADDLFRIEQAMQDGLSELLALPDGAEVSSDVLFPDLVKYQFTDNRAIGPVMKRLVAEGHLEMTERFRRSRRAGNHCGTVRIYMNAANANFNKPAAQVNA